MSKGKLEVFSYKRLVVPSSMRSIYWKFYGFPANDENEILSKSKIVCTICKTVIAYNRNTSNLRTHLVNKHAQTVLDLERESGITPKKARINDDNSGRPRKKYKKKESDQILYSADFQGSFDLRKDDLPRFLDVEEPEESSNSNHECTAVEVEGIDTSVNEVTYLLNNSLETDITKSKASNAVTAFIISDLQLPDILETVGFQRMLASLQSPCLIPSKSRFIQETLPLFYRTYKDALKVSISSCSAFSLSIEEWESDICGNFVTFSVHFLNKTSEEGLIRRVLATVHSSLIDKLKTCSDTIDDILVDFGIKPESIKATVCATDATDSVITSYLEDHGYTVIPCLHATFQKIFTTGCFSIPSVHDILVKTRTVICEIFRHSRASGSLLIQDELLQLDDTRLTSDYPAVWLSTYVMLEELLKRRSIITSVTETMNLSDVKSLTFSDDEWSIIADIVSILEPFKVVVTTLAEEKSPLLSIIKPLLNELLNSRLKVSKIDSDFAGSLKNSIVSSLKDVYSEKSVENLLKISTSLDPRLKSTVLTDDKEALKIIKDELIKVMGEIGSSTEDQEVAVTKKPKLSGMELLLRNVCVKNQPLSKSDRADIEIMQYENEPAASLEVCPLSWWQCSSVKYPYLSLLAKDYNSIPATVLPQSWIPVEKNVAFHMKRARLPLELVDPILFLHSNCNFDGV